MSRMEHLLAKARQAASSGIGVLSTGEALAAALVLNRHDWLTDMGYTIAEAIDRIDDDWVPLIPKAARMIHQADAVVAQAKASAREEVALAGVGKAGEEIDMVAKLVTYGHAPGYRDTSFTFDVNRPGASETYRFCLRIGAEDGESVVRHILSAHRSAWEGGKPLDCQVGEERPRWIDRP